ncbi:hypothetical protein [Nisaea sediminum]|uniref:hypothetical protein n=1 Tax=Nisaea sediminum TaxID=2775867 RepID=UPI001868392F|nr:hypothetical protein [Nisaea sediminum]
MGGISWRHQALEVLGTFFLLNMLLVTAAMAADFGSRYIVKSGLYPSDHVYDRGFRIPIYLPYGSIFFLDPEKQERDGKIRIISQFGQRYLIDKENIYFKNENGSIKDRTVSNLYGDQHLVFRGNFAACLVSSDSSDRYGSCDEDSKVPISRGDVSQVFEGVDAGWVELKFYDKRFDKVFLSKEKLDSLIEGGLVTDLRKKYPRYLRLSKAKVESLSTKCGSPIEKVSYDQIEKGVSGAVKVEGSFGFSLASIIDTVLGLEFRASASKKKSEVITLKEFLGGESHGVEVFALLVRDYKENLTRQFDIMMKTRCDKSSGRKPNIYIERIEIYEKDNPAPVLDVEFSQLYNWGRDEEISTSSPPYQVWKKNNNRMFFTSINTRNDYWNVFNVFLEDTEDVDLAALFISEFNASCVRARIRGNYPYKDCSEILPVKAY